MGDLSKEQAQKVQAKASLYSALLQNPEMAARAQKLGRRTGLPSEVVSRNLPEVERTLAVNDIDRMLDTNPAVVQFLTSPQYAAMAHDDVENMGQVERKVRQFGGGATEGVGMAVSGTGRIMDIVQRNVLQGLSSILLPKPKAGPMGLEPQAPTAESIAGPSIGQDWVNVGGMVKDYARKELMIPQAQQTFGDKVAAGLGQVAGQVAMLPLDRGASMFAQGADVKDGIHPDLVAESFDFSSGDELVRTLAIAEAPKVAIEQLHSVDNVLNINGNGAVLIGAQTQAGAEKLRIQASGSNDGLFIDSPSGGSGYVYRAATSSGNAAYFITTSGQAGYIALNGNTTSYVSGSDYRLKDNVRPIYNPLAKVAAMRPVAFEWKCDGSYGESFLAHELAEVCPQAVTGEKNGTRIEQYQVGTQKITKQRQVTDKTIVLEDQIVLVNGVHVLRQVEMVIEQPLFEQLPVFNEDGTPAMIVVPEVLDDDGSVIAAATQVQRMVAVPVMEEYEEDEPVMGEREVPAYQGIDTSFLVATLTAAIQEQQSIITALTARVETLEQVT